MKYMSSLALRFMLVSLGAFIVFLGINLAFGGIETLGWQGLGNFLEVTNETSYLIQDSHVRFLGGVFGGIGLFFMLASTNLPKYEIALKLAFALLFIGGVARFTMGKPDVTFSGDIVGSLAAELVLMPILFVWVSRTVRNSVSDS